MVSSASNAVFKTKVWFSTSPGFPKGLPNGNLRNMLLGGLTASATSFMRVSVIVAIPFSSKTRATRPAVCWHTGQTGTITAKSTFSRSIFLTTSGAVIFFKGCGTVRYPIKL